MDIFRVVVRWSGFTGAPGYTSLHFAGGGGLISDAQQVVDRVATAFESLKTVCSSDVRWTFPAEVEVLDSDSGQIQSFQAVDAPDPISATNQGNYSGPAGAVVNWRTNDVRFGRRIRGRTFIVPIATARYDDDGTLDSSALDSLNEFADTLASWDFDSEFGVWSRPRNGEGGVFASVTSYNVPDMVAVLRSRRD